MQLIDTHAHLYLEQFDHDRTLAVKRALESGVTHMLLPNVDEATISSMMQLHSSFPGNCIPMMAIHPTSVTKDYARQLDTIEKQLENHQFCAIGESGIDLYWDKTFFKEQCAAFEKHIELAVHFDLPLVIHSRNSLNEIFDILQNNRDKNLRGVFHCFPGNTGQAHEVIDLGFMIGVGGVVTFKNSTIAKVVENIGLEHILLETDAPYLAPVPKRGKRNESSYLVYIAEKIANIKKADVNEVASVTSKNAIDVFKLK